MQRTVFCHFWAMFCPLTLPTTQKTKILKKWKKISWRYYNFTLVYHKWRSYDVWFLRYRVWQTEFFVILGYCLPFYPLATRKIKILKKWKKHPEISSIYTSVPKIMIIGYTIPETWSVTDVVFIFHSAQFFALLPP